MTPLDPATIRRIWYKGRSIQWLDPEEWRLDSHGNLMKFSDYGNGESVVGWTVGYITPLENGGTNDIDNLQPLNLEHAAVAADTANLIVPE